MVAINLPTGYTVRAPHLDDVEAIAAHARAYTLAAVGFADYTADDVRDGLTESGFDAARDGRLVLDAAGEPAGWAMVHAMSDSDQVEIDVLAGDPPVTRLLLDWAVDRAKEIGRTHGHPRVRVDHGIYRADELLRAQVRARGFQPATTFHRMRVDHPRPAPPPPAPPAGLVLRSGTDPAVRPVAHEMLDAAFADHFGYVRKPYDTWHENLDRRSTFDWSQLWVAELDGRPVAGLECNEQFVHDEDCGYVANVGVLPAARGRGVAKYLLRHAFAVDAAAGRTGTLLHVDSNNITPALRLYESVGMRTVLVIDAWRLIVDTR